MATLIQSDAELQRAIQSDLRYVVAYMADEILKLNSQVIQEVVYDAYDPDVYIRTATESRSFKGAWKRDEKATTKGDTTEIGVSYYPYNMIQHDSAHRTMSRLLDAPDALAEIIYEGLAGNFVHGYAKYTPAFRGQPWTRKRDAWKKLLSTLGKRKIQQLFKEGCAREHLKILKQGTIDRVDF